MDVIDPLDLRITLDGDSVEAALLAGISPASEAASEIGACDQSSAAYRTSSVPR